MQFLKSATAYELSEFHSHDEPNFNLTRVLNYSHLTDVITEYSSNQFKDSSFHFFHKPCHTSEDNFEPQIHPFNDYLSFEGKRQHQIIPIKKQVWVTKVKPPARTTFCELCKCTLNSSSQAEAHFKGQVHLKKLSSHKDSNTSHTQPGDGTSLKVDSMAVKPDDAAEADSKEDDSKSANQISPSPDPSKVKVTEPPTKKKKVVLSIPCEVCNNVFNSEIQADHHFKSLKHLKKLKRNALSESILNLHGSLISSIHKKDSFHCNFCNVDSNSSLQFNQHCSGQGHKKKVNALSSPENEVKGNKRGWFYCRICNISCQTSLGLHRHVLSEDHKSKSPSLKSHLI